VLKFNTLLIANVAKKVNSRHVSKCRVFCSDKIVLAGVPPKVQVRVMGLCENGEILLKQRQMDKSGNNYLFYNPKTDVLKYSHIPSLNGDTKVLCHMCTLLSIAKFGAAE
jgi:hypothetical protein